MSTKGGFWASGNPTNLARNRFIGSESAITVFRVRP
jgi:hypothetical protein